MNQSQVEKAFSLVAPKKPAVVAKSITYTDAHTCPYCQGAMVKVKIRKMDGTFEPVYLCRSDQAVGVVPDSELV